METLIILQLIVTFVSLAFGQQSLTFTIFEEQPSGGQVGSVADVPLSIPAEERTSVRYSFFNNDNPSQLYFTIGDINGIIRTQVRLDRETICPTLLSTNCELDFKVAAKSQSLTFFETINVKVIIEDINDNAPMFPNEAVTLEILEGVNSVNTRYLIPSAKDPDTGSSNGIQSYEINPLSDQFDLISEKQLDGTFLVEVLVKKELNREVKDMYQIRIIAKDGGASPKTGSLTVHIKVLDINDNKPVFSSASYNVTVDEGLIFGSSVLTVHASDLDIGRNGQVSYRISDRFIQILEDFSINSSSGVISVARDVLIYHPGSYYSFIVEAIDNGTQPLVSQVYVYIYVKDTGNNPPKVTLSLLSPGNIGFVNISENSKLGSFVAFVTVEDSDTGDNGKVECYVTNSFFNVVKLQEDGAYKVVIANTLDREVKDLYNVTVTCSDFGSPRLSSIVSFLVRVTDFNDNAPEFLKPIYTAKIEENTMTEQIILQVSATDKDIDENQKIHYEIPNQDKISVNTVTGIISVKPFFDREKTPTVTFVVLAIDGGEIPLTGTATVSLTITDVNDNKPTFVEDTFLFKIQENLKTGTIVGQLSARDSDAVSNGSFTFSPRPNVNGIRFPFDVFKTGIIQLNQELDREEVSRYDFEVTVTDQGLPPLSSTAVVTVLVMDVNDNRPNITFPTKMNKTASVFYPAEVVTIVTRVEAHDVDAGENGTLQYSILKGNEIGLFKIEEDSGVMYINDNTVRIDQDITIALQIEVRDKGVVSLASTEELIVNVVYTNATYGEVQAENSKFVVIVVVVVIVTVVLSALIIGIIFLLRTLDRKRKQVESPNVLNDTGFTNKPSLFIMNNAGESSTDYGLVNGDAGRKKKEVSFSLEDQDSISNYQHSELRVSMCPEPSQYISEKPSLEKSDSTQDLYNKFNTRLESLKLQRMLQLVKQPPQHVVHPDDSRSESSGETSSGDSGRGASEEEVTSASPSHDDQKMFEYSVSSKVPSTKPAQSPKREAYSAVPPPIPCRTYKPYASFNNNQSYTPNHRQYQSIPHYKTDFSVLDPSMLSWQHRQPLPHQPVKSCVPVAQNDLAYMMAQDAQHRNVLRSQDDDDCSTTTSGSYTLQTIEDLL